MLGSEHPETAPETMDEQNKTALKRIRNLIVQFKSVEDDEKRHIVSDEDSGSNR